MPLIRWVFAPIETLPGTLLGIGLLGGTSMVLAILIDIADGGLGDPAEVMALLNVIGWKCSSAFVEEAVFRHLPKRLLRDNGIAIGTVIWLALHLLVAPLFLGSTALGGLLYLKVWRGRSWKSAYWPHPLWNLCFVLLVYWLSYF